MPPRMRTRSAGWPAAESLGGGTGIRVGRGGRGRRPREVNGSQVGCSYKEFLACNPKEYDGKGSVVVLTRWIDKMKSVHDMSGCSIDQKVKYTTGSFVGKGLTWWNSQIRTLSREVAVSMSWNDFNFMMIQEFCPSHEMQKLESDLWNHAMGIGGSGPGLGHAAKYVYGLAPQIRGMVAATELKTMQKAMQISGALTDEADSDYEIKDKLQIGKLVEIDKGERPGRESKMMMRSKASDKKQEECFVWRCVVGIMKRGCGGDGDDDEVVRGVEAWWLARGGGGEDMGRWSVVAAGGGKGKTACGRE
ncbi:hypothetical protein Tco_0488778 [Tanacetum coccineum]